MEGKSRLRNGRIWEGKLKGGNGESRECEGKKKEVLPIEEGKEGYEEGQCIGVKGQAEYVQVTLSRTHKNGCQSVCVFACLAECV